jgi:hypothetical protein
MGFIQNLFATIWNILLRRQQASGLRIGFQIRDGLVSRRIIKIPHHLRPEHIAILGKTGTGKSSLLRYLMSQDVSSLRGFACIDLHGDLIPFVLATIAKKEKQTGLDLSRRLLVIDPSHQKYSIGLNLIGCDAGLSRPVLISEMVALLRLRWGLDHFGARTEELLRNSLWVLSENDLTLLELSPLLTNSTFRLSLLKNVSNVEVKNYFEDRYNRVSDAMQTVMREAVLNKLGSFTVDPAIRHIVGQKHSSFSLQAAIDQGFWILLNLRKGELGDNALTFAGLFLAKFKNAIFGRSGRSLFTLYADELPNLVSVDDAFLTLLSEARKFSVSVVSANQFLNQFSPAMKSALFSLGTNLCFELSAEDAPFMARVLNGENPLVRRLITLPHRQFIGRFGEFVEEVFVPEISRPELSISGLVHRSLRQFGRLREEIEKEINARRPNDKTEDRLEDWQ